LFKDLIKKPQPLASKFVPTTDGDIDATLFLLLSVVSNGSISLDYTIKKLNADGEKL
jgi:hypothetical protein